MFPQHLVDHLFVAPSAQEEALPGGTEGPHVAVLTVLPPARLITTYRGALSHRHHRLGPTGHPVQQVHDGPHAQLQLVDGGQVPLDRA